MWEEETTVIDKIMFNFVKWDKDDDTDDLDDIFDDNDDNIDDQEGWRTGAEGELFITDQWQSCRCWYPSS